MPLRLLCYLKYIDRLSCIFVGLPLISPGTHFGEDFNAVMAFFESDSFGVSNT